MCPTNNAFGKIIVILCVRLEDFSLFFWMLGSVVLHAFLFAPHRTNREVCPRPQSMSGSAQ